MTRSIPNMSSSGNARPQSTTTMLSPYSNAVMFMPICSRPPSGMIRREGAGSLFMFSLSFFNLSPLPRNLPSLFSPGYRPAAFFCPAFLYPRSAVLSAAPDPILFAAISFVLSDPAFFSTDFCALFFSGVYLSDSFFREASFFALTAIFSADFFLRSFFL